MAVHNLTEVSVDATPYRAMGFQDAVVLPVFGPGELSLEEKISLFLHESGNVGKTRTQICKEVKTPRTTVYDALNRMMIQQKVEIDYRHVKGKRGRPKTLFFLKGVEQGNRR